MAKIFKNHRWVKKEKSGSITIGFKYQKRAYKFAPVARGRFDNGEDMVIANRVASEIEQAVKLGKFEGLDPWKPRTLEDKTGIGDPNPYTLRDIWRDYKITKGEKVSKASQLSQWGQVDRCLESLPSVCSTFVTSVGITPQRVVYELLKEYSPHVVLRVLQDLHAACNLALKRKLIPLNPLTGFKDELPDTAKGTRSKDCYSHDEAMLIIEAFNQGETSCFSQYKGFVEFLFLTGVRPQLAIALTWGDVQEDKIIFNKGYTKGVITEGKTGRTTHYPLYPQLKELIDRVKGDWVKADNRWQNGIEANMHLFTGSLVFPSPTGKYINLHNFTNRIWKPLITGLVESGKLSKYLPTYNCRHSAATFLAKAGLPSSTIAALLDTSEQMLNRHYLNNQELTNVVIPDLLKRGQTHE